MDIKIDNASTKVLIIDENAAWRLESNTRTREEEKECLGDEEKKINSVWVTRRRG